MLNQENKIILPNQDKMYHTNIQGQIIPVRSRRLISNNTTTHNTSAHADANGNITTLNSNGHVVKVSTRRQVPSTSSWAT